MHSALSIQPGSMRTLISVWGPRAPSRVLTWPVTIKWGSEGGREANSIKLVRVSWDAGGWPREPVTVCQICQSQRVAAASSVLSAGFSVHQWVSTLPFVFHPNPILPQLFRLPSERGAVPTKHPPFHSPALLPLFVPSELSSGIKLESVLSKLVLWYHNLKLQYNNPLLDHFNPIIAPQTDYCWG